MDQVNRLIVVAARPRATAKRLTLAQLARMHAHAVEGEFQSSI